MANSGIPSNELNTRISIDDMGAITSLRGLKSQVSALMNSWKAQNAMLESVGERLEAAKTRYDGLGDAITKQNEVIDKLKSEQAELDTSTSHGAEVFAKLQKQIALAGKQLANMQAQQKRAAESVAYYQAGVDKANDALSRITTHTNALVDRLTASGSAFDVVRASMSRYDEQLSKLNDLYEARSKQAASIAETEGKESKAYKDVSDQLDTLSVKIAQTTAKRNEASDALYKYQAGITKSNEDLDTAVRHNDALVKSLDAQGKHSAAAQKQADGLAAQLAKLNDLYDKEKAHLDVIANSQGKDSKAYKDTAATVDRLTSKIAATKTAYDAANNQAHAYSTGIVDLKDHLATLNAQGDNLVARLKAQGRSYEANVAQSRNYKAQLSDLTALLAKQRDELSRVASEQGNDSDAYKKLDASIDDTKTKIEELKAADEKLNKSFNSTAIARAKDSFNKISASAHNIGDGIKSAAGKVVGAATAATAGIAGLSAGFVAASSKAADLQNSFHIVNNLLITGGEKAADATREVAQMQKDARKYSVEYGVSMQSIADAYATLTRRGFTGAQSLGAMKSMLEACRASGDSLTDVVHNSSSALEAYGMKVDSTTGMLKNTSKVDNALAYVSDATSTSFESLGQALAYVGANAHTSGVSLTNTISALGVMSNRGLEGTKGARSLDQAITALTASFSGQVRAMNSSAAASAAKTKAQAKLTLANKKLADMTSNLNSMTDKNSAAYKKAAQAVAEQKIKVQGLQDSMQAINNVKPARSMLAAIGVKPSDLTTANGKLKSLSDIFDIINAHTKSMSAAKKAGVFQAIFGTTGSRAAMILSENTGLLRKLDKQAADAYHNNYIDRLAKKNMGTAKMAEARFKQTSADLAMSLSARLLPVVNKLSDNLVEVANSKGFQKLVDQIGDGVSTLGTHVSHLFDYIGKHSKDITSIGRSIASIIGELSNGIWSFFKATIIDIGKAFGAFTGKKDTSGIHSVAEAMAAIAKHKQTIIDIGKAIAAYFVTKHLLSFAGAIGKVGSGFIGLGKIVAKTKPAKTLLEKLLGTDQKAKLTSEATSSVTNAVEQAGSKATPTVAKTGLSIGKGIASKLGAGLGIAFNAGTAIHGLFFEHGNSVKRYEDVGSGIAGTIGGAIGGAIGGPVGSMILGTAGSVMGRVGGMAAKAAVSGWHKLGGWAGIQKDIGKTCASIGKNVGKFTAGVVKQFDSFNSSIASGIGKTWSNFTKTVSDTTKTVNKNINSFVASVGKTWDKFGDTLNRLTGGTWDKVTSAFSKGRDDVTHIFADMQDILTGKAKDGASQRIQAANDEYQKQMSISNHQMTDTIRNANTTCEQSINAAQRKRDSVIAKATDEYENDHSISYNQYQDVVNAANQQCKESVDAARVQRDKTIAHAHEEHEKAVYEATKQKDERIQAAKDEGRGTNSAYEDMLQHMADIYNNIADGLNSILKHIDGKSQTIPKWRPSHSYATGTSGAVNGGEYALVGEEGFELAKTGNSIYPIGVDSPEIRWLPEGTQILPHDMSKAFSSLAAGLPHYKKGKDKDNFLSEAAKWVKGKIKDVADLVHKGADTVVKDLFKALGWDSYQKSLIADVKQYTVEGVGKHIKDAAIDKLKSVFGDWTSQHDGGGAGGSKGGGVSGFGGAATPQEAQDVIKHAMQIDGVSGSDWFNGLEIIGHYESGFRNVVNEWDSNAAKGTPSAGWFQMIEPTFDAYAKPGYDSWRDPLDQAVSTIRYIQARYGGIGNVPGVRSVSHGGPYVGYADGGIANVPSVFAEAGAEMAIPLTTGKRSRAYELLGQLTTMFASQDGLHRGAVNNNDDKITALLEQNNKLMSVLVKLAGGSLDELKKTNNNATNTPPEVAKQQFYREFGRDSKLNGFSSFA